MANNLFADVPAAVVAKSTVSFVAAGFTSSNCRIIYEVGSPLKSWVPDRDINAITGFTAGKGYYVVPSADMDMEAILIPPVPTGGGSTTPAAPTAGVVDDSADTFNWTNNPLYPDVSDYEFTLNGGTSWAAATAKPIAVGNVAKAIGQVGVRVKAVGGDNPSAGLFNASAFNVAADPFLAVTVTLFQILEGPTGTFTDDSGSGNGRGVSDLTMAGDGRVYCKYNDNATNGGTFLALDPNSDLDDSTTYDFSFFPFSGQIYVREQAAQTGPLAAVADGDLLSLRRVVSSGAVLMEKSSDNGATWTLVHTYTGTSTAPLYAKFRINDIGKKISEFRGNGFA